MFLESVQKAMLTGALFYLISSHLELMSSLCQHGDGAVNIKVEEQRIDRGKRRVKTAYAKAFFKYKGNQDMSSNMPGPV